MRLIRVAAGSQALSKGLKMQEVLTAHWTDLLALAAALGALWKYFQSRRDDLAWRRTEMLFKLGDRIDGDSSIGQAVDLIYDRLPGIHISQLFDDSGTPHDGHHGALLGNVDRFLNVLERVAHSHFVLHTLSLAEVQTLGGHFQSVLMIERLRKYCLQHGYKSVIALGELLTNASARKRKT